MASLSIGNVYPGAAGKPLASGSLKTALHRVIALLKQGLTVRHVSLGLALALTVAVFPVVVLPMVVCALLGALLGLNQPLMQTINYVVGPIQIMLFLPFMRLGEYVFGFKPFPLDMEALRTILDKDMADIMRELGVAIGHAAAGWALCAPFLFVILYCGLLGCLKPLAEKTRRKGLLAGAVRGLPSRSNGR